MEGKYTFSVAQATSAVNDSQNITNGLLLDVFTLTVHNFNSSTDDGHYWCQIVINDSCPLQPLWTIGHVALGRYPTTKCAYNMTLYMYEMPPVCAEESPCTGEILTNQITTVNREIAIKTNGAKSPAGQSNTVILYGAIGGLLFIIVLLLIIVGCTVYNVGNHKIITATRGMPSSVSNPYMYNTSYTILYIHHTCCSK